MSFLQRPLILVGLLLLVLVLGYFWFATSHTETVVPSQTTAQTPHVVRTTDSTPSSPFMPTHTPRTVFTPNESNVSPNVHAELQRLKQTTDETPENAEEWLKLARLQHDGHQLEEAVAAYEQYVALRPTDQQAWLDLAQTYGLLNRWTDAQTAMETLLVHHPNDPSAMYNLGAIHANQGRFAEARRWWEPVAAQTADAKMQGMATQALARIPAEHP